MENNVQELLRDLKTTKGARFNAAKRLEGRDRRMALLTALASALVIALTVLPFIYKLHGPTAGDIGAIIVLMSVLILAVSLLQYSNNDAVTAEQHHRCALELNELRRDIRARAESINAADVMQCGDRYAQILQKYSVNHDDIDYNKYQIEHPEEYPLGRLSRLRIWVRILASTYWPAALMWGIAGFAVWFFVVAVFPARM